MQTLMKLVVNIIMLGLYPRSSEICKMSLVLLHEVAESFNALTGKYFALPKNVCLLIESSYFSEMLQKLFLLQMF